MSEFPKNSIDNQQSRRGRIAQVLAICSALTGGCGATVQNAETKVAEEVSGNISAKPTQPEKTPVEQAPSQGGCEFSYDAAGCRPKWLDGPEVFEKDGYTYVKASKSFDSEYRQEAENEAMFDIEKRGFSGFSLVDRWTERDIPGGDGDGPRDDGIIHILVRVKK